MFERKKRDFFYPNHGFLSYQVLLRPERQGSERRDGVVQEVPGEGGAGAEHGVALRDDHQGLPPDEPTQGRVRRQAGGPGLPLQPVRPPGEHYRRGVVELPPPRPSWEQLRAQDGYVRQSRRQRVNS